MSKSDWLKDATAEALIKVNRPETITLIKELLSSGHTPGQIEKMAQEIINKNNLPGPTAVPAHFHLMAEYLQRKSKQEKQYFTGPRIVLKPRNIRGKGF